MRGGKREGSGRKPKGNRLKVKINISIDPGLLEWIDSITDNRSDLIENVLLSKKNENQ